MEKRASSCTASHPAQSESQESVHSALSCLWDGTSLLPLEGRLPVSLRPQCPDLAVLGHCVRAPAPTNDQVSGLPFLWLDTGSSMVGGGEAENALDAAPAP